MIRMLLVGYSERSAPDENKPSKRGGGCVIALMLVLVVVLLFVESVWKTLSKLKLH